MKVGKMTKRYNHWFWNQPFIGWIEGICVRFGSYLWRKQYSRDK